MNASYRIMEEMHCWLHLHKSMDPTSQSMMVTVYLLVLVNCLCAFQVYVMVVFDNFEVRYTSKKNRKLGTQARRIGHAHCGFAHASELAMAGWLSFFL